MDQRMLIWIGIVVAGWVVVGVVITATAWAFGPQPAAITGLFTIGAMMALGRGTFRDGHR